ncbi:LLM class flavin-dependent oxidoreductase [Candidatus Bathyarchaeota archaeon]|nr:LLM class flavin-dependent oxidoreductase [Candidatus Bathyarchaeota archaeon]
MPLRIGEEIMVLFGVSLPTGREGLMVPAGFASRETIVEAAVNAEELGFDSVWGNDHVTVQDYVSHLRPKPAFFEPIVAMAAVSSATRRVKLATGIFVLPWRTPSLVVCAKQLATLDALSGGRVLLGVGTGAYTEESSALGVRHRRGRMIEGVEAMRVLFNDDPATYKGKYVEFEGVQFYPRPLQKPFPVYLGRHLTTDRVLRYLAVSCQGWIHGLYPGQFREALPRLEGFLKEQGRSLSDIDVVKEITVCQGATREKALGRYFDSPAEAHMQSLSEGKKLVEFGEESRWSLIGAPGDIIKGVESYLDAGVNHFMFNFVVKKRGDLVSGMEAFAEEVMPSFR